MTLKDILSSKSDEPKEYFWSVVIEPGWVQAGVWRIFEDKTQIISTSPPTAWELDEELVNAVDTSLSASIQNFPDDVIEPAKAVFGVMSGWVTEGEIKKDYIERIKKICSELSLTPVGFVVLPEAMAHFIKSEEGSPLNAVVLGISKEEMEISVFKLGKLIGTSQIARSLSVVDDVVEGLTRFSESDPLPSRLIIYDGKERELEEVKQTLLKANWDDFPKVKFLHTPKIEAFDSEKKVHAVALAGASELADITSVHSLKEEEVKDEEVENVIPAEEPVSPQELGFVVGQDVAAMEATDKLKPKDLEEKPAKDVEIIPSAPTKAKKEKPFIRPKVQGLLGVIKDKFPKSLESSKKTFIFGGLFFIILILGFFAFWWFYPKATVTIYLSTKRLDERVDITIDPGSDAPDLSEKVLPGEVLATSATGDKTKSTTGTRTVGEKAKGEVTLYRVGSQISLAAGTKLAGPNNLEFSIDEGMTVASGSASTPGTTNAFITALDIGAQYNLAGGTTFSVGNYSLSDIEAKSEQAFSGGSSREISAVADEDQKVLEEELEEELTNKAQEELLGKLSEDKFFIDESLTSTPSSKTFSDKVGDEASTLKLSLSLDVEGVAVKKDDLFELSKEALKDKIPEGFVLRSDQVDVEFDFLGELNGSYNLRTFVSANLLPEVDPDEVATKIVGRLPAVVEDYLRNEIPGFSKAKITFNKPRFPGRLGTLPRVVDHIEVIIAAEK